MYPPIFVADHRIGPAASLGDSRHHDRPPAPRRGAPVVLVMMPDPATAPHGPHAAVIPVVPAPPEIRRAALVALAADPRFQRRALPAPRTGLRVRLGQWLMALGWQLVRRAP
ncbi:hypothetical protein [Pelagovum sp. HNIBRBA483]|uniref:hypothetical protein n=1 Tax=Pelagovum sp. HNIBRBA483 TaxID=3233341 RepID=UPI0034A17948